MSERVRYMRLLVFFDLPMETASQRREYAQFRKHLLKSGYLMVQKSVYSKLAIDNRIVETYIERLRQNKPPEGLIQALLVTERQYAGIVRIVGDDSRADELDTTESLVVL